MTELLELVSPFVIRCENPVDWCFSASEMLTCIACSKQLNNGSLHQQEGEDSVATPRTKQTIKALTAQVNILRSEFSLYSQKFQGMDSVSDKFAQF